jgi:hypothetical protein
MKITSTKESSDNCIKMIVYGESGVGKTSLAKTIKEKTLIVSSEAGLLCLKDAQPAIDVIDITRDDNGKAIPKENRIAKLNEVYRFLQTKECLDKYKWVFIDSLTEISQNMVEALNKEFPDRKDSLVLYGENAKRMRGLIKSFRDLPGLNVIFTALPSIEKDEHNKRYTTINMIGKIADQVAAFFDLCLYMTTVEDKEGAVTSRYLRTEKSDNLVCKDRSGCLSKFEPANIDHIYNKIFKNNKEKVK